MTEAVALERNIIGSMLSSNRATRESDSKSKGTPTTDLADNG